MTSPLGLVSRAAWLLLAMGCVVALIVVAPSAAMAGGSAEDGSVSVTVDGIGLVELSVSLEVAGGSVAAVSGETYAFTVAPGAVQVSLSSSGSTAVVDASCAPNTITIDIGSQAVDGDEESHSRSVVVDLAEGATLDCQFVVASGDSSGGRFGAF